MTTLEDVFDIYSNEFLPTYARAVAELQDKPIQITVEIENAFSHLSVYSKYQRNGNQEKQLEHLNKACAHIQRATLDAYKFVWVSLLRKSKVFDRPGILEFATKVDIDKVIPLHEDFKKKASEARVKELSSLEENVSVRNVFYRDAVIAADNLFDCLDAKKLRKFKSFSFWYIIKSNSVAFALGVIAGVTGNFLTESIKSKVN